MLSPHLIWNKSSSLIIESASMVLPKSRHQKLLHKALGLFDELVSMAILLGHMNREIKGDFSAQEQDIRSATNARLEIRIDDLKHRIDSIREEYGATLRIGEYAKIIKSSRIREDLTLIMRVHALLSYFSDYPVNKSLMLDGRYPPHALIELDHRGELDPHEAVEIHLPEAMLFEDMCYFFNKVYRLSKTEFVPSPSIEAKKIAKELAALKRGVILSAFHMVEAYVNGLAYEIKLTKSDQLTEKEKILVTEWDAKNKVQKFVSARDKLLKYPKILMGKAHPLLDEANCPDLRFLLTEAKRFRDSITHQNPSGEKGKTFSEISYENCEKTVDSAIGVVDKLCIAMEREKPFWLQKRPEKGFFDDSVFV